MKVKLLVAALALITGTAFAQATNSGTTGTPAAGAATSATAGSTSSTSAAGTEKKAHKKVAHKKSKKSHARKKAGTQAMGAGPAMLQTDLGAPARQARIDQAYAHWQSARR